MDKIGHFGENGLCVHPWSPKCRKKVVFWSHGISLAKMCPQLNLSGHWGAMVLFSNRKISDFWRFWGQKRHVQKQVILGQKGQKSHDFFIRDGRT